MALRGVFQQSELVPCMKPTLRLPTQSLLAFQMLEGIVLETLLCMEKIYPTFSTISGQTAVRLEYRWDPDSRCVYIA